MVRRARSMKTNRIVAALASTTVLWIGTLQAASAQRITYEADGRTRTYDFNQPTTDKKAGRPTARSRSAELPRGPKNLPWEEPGKLTGDSRVQESGTTLQLKRLRRAARQSRKKGRIEEAQRSRSETQKTSTGLPTQDRRGASGPEVEAHTQVPASPQSNRPTERAPEISDAQSEIRARIISEAVARASAEEQRRLDLEKKRDPRLRRSEPQERSNEMLPATTQADPATTGAIGYKASKPLEEPVRGKWSGACRLLFFGALPGC
jgi:hypothetical protein